MLGPSIAVSSVEVAGRRSFHPETHPPATARNLPNDHTASVGRLTTCTTTCGSEMKYFVPMGCTLAVPLWIAARDSLDGTSQLQKTFTVERLGLLDQSLILFNVVGTGSGLARRKSFRDKTRVSRNERK